MISKSDIVEAIRVQRERLRKFQSFRRDLLLSLPPLVADYALIISGIRRCGKSTLLAQLSVDRYKPEEVLSLNFDTPLLYGFEFSDFRIVDEVIKEHEGCIALLFDEIQIVDGWEVYIRGKLDEGFYVGIYLLFLYSFLRRWCQKAYTNTGTFHKGISIDFGTV